MIDLLDAPIGYADAVSTCPVRPLRADDIERVRRFFDRLSAESLYRRFFTGGRRSDTEVRRLFAPDVGATRDALVAVLGDEVIGLVEGVHSRHAPGLVDLGVVVADEWQRCGIGLQLVRALVDRAVARGAVTLQADTLADNHRMARLIRRLWPDARPHRDGSTFTWSVPLGGPPRAEAA